MYTFIILTIYCSIFVNVHAQESPCPNIFNYKKQGNKDYGILSLNINPANSIEIKMSMTLRTSKEASLTLKHKQSREALSNILKHGGILTFQVDFTQFNPRARIKEIILNKRTICKNSNDIALTLRTFSYTTVISNSKFATTKPPRITTRRPNSNDYQCGTTAIVSQRSFSNVGHTDIKEWPWLVSLLKLKKASLQFFCGGTVISKKNILTAAHCMTKKYDSDFEVIDHTDVMVNFGSNNPLIQDDNYGFRKRVQKIYPHHNYNPDNLHNDIAVLEVTSFRYNDAVIPICLPNGETVDRSAKVAGWGEDAAGRLQDLVYLHVPLVTNSVCKKSDAIFNTDNLIWEKNLCGGGNGLGPCKGDSGNGLFVQHNGLWILKGIVSFNIMDNTNTCQNNKHYSVYTNVIKYIKWINDII